MDFLIEDRLVCRHAYEHLLFHQLDKMFADIVEERYEPEIVDKMSSSIPGAWKPSYDSDTWPVSRTLCAVANEAWFGICVARKLVAGSPNAISYLAIATGHFAKEAYKEWRSPRVRYNIHHLPDDLLADIVELCLMTDDPSEADTLAAIPLSHVSRRFRFVVLGLPKLWTTISTDMSVRWNKKAVKRSKKQLLNVHCKCIGSSSEVFDIARNHSARWKTFSLVVGIESRVYTLPVVRGLRGLVLANLESLRLIYRRPTHSGFKAVDNNVHCYGKLNAPKLKHIEFVNIIPRSFSLNKARFTLTKLSFIYASSWEDQYGEEREHAWEFGRLLRFLEEMKTVNEVDLVLIVHELDLPPLMPVELPHITKFSFRIEDTIEETVDPLLRAIRLPNLQFLSFGLAYSTGEHHDMEMFEDAELWTRESCAVNPYLSVLLHPGFGEQQMPYAHLTELELDVQVEPEFIKDNFKIPFHLMPKLERLQVSTNRNVFAPRPHQLQEIAQGSLPLKELRLVDCDGMKNLTWLRTLSEYMNHECLERVVAEGELGCSRGTIESLERFFSREKIHVAQSKTSPDDRETVCQFADFLC